MRRALTIMHSVVAIVVAAACGDYEVPPTDWNGVPEKEFEALNGQFEDPDGPLTAELLKPILLETLDDEFRLAGKALNDTVGHVLAAQQAETSSGKLTAALTVTGSNAYIRAACPGPDTEHPDVLFGHGQVRFDAPAFLPKQIAPGKPIIDKATLKDGQVLLTFTDCVSGKVTLKGTSAALYDTAHGLVTRLTLDLAIDGQPPRKLAQPVRFGGKVFELLLETELGSYVLDVGSLPHSITIRGEGKTSVTCTLKSGKATCPIGSGQTATFEIPQK